MGSCGLWVCRAIKTIYSLIFRYFIQMSRTTINIHKVYILEFCIVYKLEKQRKKKENFIYRNKIITKVIYDSIHMYSLFYLFLLLKIKVVIILEKLKLCLDGVFKNNFMLFYRSIEQKFVW